MMKDGSQNTVATSSQMARLSWFPVSTDAKLASDLKLISVPCFQFSKVWNNSAIQVQYNTSKMKRVVDDAIKCFAQRKYNYIYKKKATTKILFILLKKNKAILNLVLQWNCYDSSAYIQKTQNKSEAVKV